MEASNHVRPPVDQLFLPQQNPQDLPLYFAADKNQEKQEVSKRQPDPMQEDF